MTDQEKKDFLAEESLIAEKAHLKYEALIMGIAAKFKELHPDAVVTHVTTVNHAEPVFNNDPCTECKKPIGFNRVIVARTGEKFCSVRCSNKSWQRHRRENPKYSTKVNGDGLTEEKVVGIKRLLHAGYDQSEVSRRTGIPKGTITSIHLGRTWADVRVPKDDIPVRAPDAKWKSKVLTYEQAVELKEDIYAEKLPYKDMCSKYKIKYAYLMMVKHGAMFADIKVAKEKPFIQQLGPGDHPDIVETGIPVSIVPFRCHHCDQVLTGKIFEDQEAHSFCNHTCYRAYVNSDQFRKDSGLDDFHVKLKRLAVNNEKVDRAVRPEINR